ncbi:GNAT family N-acetyltransferase [Kurthia sibirica]|uniref:GNAT family N-acetyltransferase n=1 Tax=Kurthia sibirica TaxID=202750 RepID=A0A2U3AK69_9BACL|nr:GNAT family N-acetyltransferase [Kurthia sibirica]PWI24915.1 GNAT family N-acetyltransferase [Kurthia sibirica]GEK33175.1 N-acetyltransferase [Kurthia sibirica]
MEFTLKQLDGAGAFIYEKDGKVLAEISWTQLGDILVVEHTFVDDSLRGQGIAKQLVNRVSDYARAEGFKIEAVCSYVVAAFNRSTEYDDIKA